MDPELYVPRGVKEQCDTPTLENCGQFIYMEPKNGGLVWKMIFSFSSVGGFQVNDVFSFLACFQGV